MTNLPSLVGPNFRINIVYSDILIDLVCSNFNTLAVSNLTTNLTTFSATHFFLEYSLV